MEDKTIIERGNLMNENCMTGQEWYDKFKEEVSKDGLTIFTIEEAEIAEKDGVKAVVMKRIFNAAKRASGVE